MENMKHNFRENEKLQNMIVIWEKETSENKKKDNIKKFSRNEEYKSSDWKSASTPKV